VPIEIQNNLFEYVLNSLIPDIMEYFVEKVPIIDGFPTKYFLSFRELVNHTGSLKPAFDRHQQYDLFEMEYILLFPRPAFSKVVAEIVVGAAIRISKVIGKEEHADKMYEFVKDSFTPEEHPDLDNEHRIDFCNEEDDDDEDFA
jgi:hypothetical protein